MRELSVEIAPFDSSDYSILKVRGSISFTTYTTLDSHLNELIKQNRYNIIVDMSETDFISSSGIRVLLATAGNLRKKGGDLIFMNVNKVIEQIFDLLNLDDHFRVISSPEELASERK